ncbi:MAG: hypothetical protein LBS59_09215 [Puniceicoccales bacterium]|jgi:hypothetical protein|nr:hypothetical protein [Puniceicoccales bacterium]
MNDNFTDIENALRRLAPRTPSALCQARIAAALETNATSAPASRLRHVPILWSAFAMAAAACLVFVLLPNDAGVSNSAPRTSAPTAVSPASVPAAMDIAAARRARVTLELAAPTDAPSTHRVINSIEPLEPRRTPDGRFFQPYRVRYLDTTRTRSGAGTTLVKSVPTEAVHYVGIDLI